MVNVSLLIVSESVEDGPAPSSVVIATSADKVTASIGTIDIIADVNRLFCVSDMTSYGEEASKLVDPPISLDIPLEETSLDTTSSELEVPVVVA
jgi:hypothetical protein